MFYREKRFEHTWCGTEDLFCGCFQIASAIFDFEVWELPQMGVYNTCGPLPDKKPAAVLDDKSCKMARRGREPSFEVRELTNAVFMMCETMFRNRTYATLRRFWRADERPKFHERLVKSRTAARKVVCFTS